MVTGYTKGKKVNAYRKQPVTFQLIDDKKTPPQTNKEVPTIRQSELKKLNSHSLLRLPGDVEIVSYKFELEGPTGEILASLNKGNKHNATTTDLINRVNKGKMIIIESIIGLKDGKETKYPAVIYKVI